jgi:16S rRNA (adenine1518-N6/adenine1519-N6)-dimethyltransferase
VIRLTCHEKPPVEISDEAFLFKVIRASFNQRRKTLVNGLNNAPTIPVSKENIIKTLEELGYSATIRGETLTLQEFARLSEALKTKIG